MASDEHKPNFIEQVEACRPGSDDLRSPEFALAAERVASDPAVRRYYESVQRTDARLQQAFHEVALPAGLAERLLAALDAAAPPAPSVELRRASPRRTALRVAIAASLVAVVGGGLAIYGLFAPYSTEQCLLQSSAASAQLQPQRWKSIRTTPAPAERLPKTRLFSSVRSWQRVSLLGDDEAVAFRFANGATLLVCQPSKSVAGLPAAPPAVPQQKATQSAGVNVGAWVDGGLVHLLTVPGPVEEYRRITGTRRPVVALARPQSLPDRYDG